MFTVKTDKWEGAKKKATLHFIKTIQQNFIWTEYLLRKRSRCVFFFYFMISLKQFDKRRLEAVFAHEWLIHGIWLYWCWLLIVLTHLSYTTQVTWVIRGFLKMSTCKTAPYRRAFCFSSLLYSQFTIKRGLVTYFRSTFVLIVESLLRSCQQSTNYMPWKQEENIRCLWVHSWRMSRIFHKAPPETAYFGLVWNIAFGELVARDRPRKSSQISLILTGLLDSAQSLTLMFCY